MRKQRDPFKVVVLGEGKSRIQLILEQQESESQVSR